MLYAELGLAFVLMPLALTLPGFFFLRRLDWPPLETLVASIGASIVITYLEAFVLYQLDAPRAFFWIVAAAGIAAGLGRPSAVRALLRDPEVAGALRSFALLTAWTLALLALVRNYSMGDWSGDWYEHYQRMSFFLLHLPMDTHFLVGYTLPSRPPLMNLVQSFFVALNADRMEIYQAVTMVLNLLGFFGCLLVAGTMTGRRPRAAVLFALLATSPMFIQNGTYTYTRGLTVFLVLLGIHFYLAGWRSPDRTRMIAAMVTLTAASLAHHSALPFLVVIVAHYLVAVLPRRAGGAREAALAAGVSLALAATWIVWCAAHYGAGALLGASPVVTEARGSSIAANVAARAANLVDSVVPWLFRGESLAGLGPASAPARLRDGAGFFYQTNAIFAMGAAGGPLVLWLLARRLRRALASAGDRSLTRFWIFLIAAGTLVGIGVIGGRYPLGVAHFCLQPFFLLGIGLVACEFPALPGAARAAVLAGAVVDFALGILLHFSVQNFDPGPAAAEGTARITYAASMNWQLKQVSRQAFLGDHLERWSLELRVALVLGLIAILLGLLRESRAPSPEARAAEGRATATV